MKYLYINIEEKLWKLWDHGNLELDLKNQKGVWFIWVENWIIVHEYFHVLKVYCMSYLTWEGNLHEFQQFEKPQDYDFDILIQELELNLCV